MKSAHPTAGRLLKFVCVFDEDVREVRDLGLMRGGDPSGQRQAIIRMTEKQANIDGKRVAVFMLHEPPTEEFSEHDKLDQGLRTKSGEWELPSPAWLAVRATQVAKATARRNEASERALSMATSSLAEQLGGLMKQTAAATPPTKGAR